MTLSARNRLEGKIVELQFGGVMAHVVVRVGKNLIESVITKRSADEVGKEVDACSISQAYRRCENHSFKRREWMWSVYPSRQKGKRTEQIAMWFVG